MKYLLDTAVWIWSLGEAERIRSQAREILEDGDQEIYLSAASSWEIAIKMRLGKLNFPGPPAHRIPKFMAQQGLRPLTILHSHTTKIYDLPPHHDDPFDRLLIAQAMVEKMVVLTADRAFAKYSIEVMWCGK